MSVRIVGLGIAALAMVACQSAGNNNDMPDMASGGITASLTLWNDYHAGGQEEAAFNQVLANILSANPRLHVNVVNIDFDHVYQTWEQQVGAGGGPDLFVAPNDNFGDEVRKNVLADITNEVSGQLGSVSQLAMAGMTYQNKVYGVPVVIKAVGLYYNKSKITTPPTTTDSLQAMVAGGKKLVIPANAYHPFGFWAAFGGSILDDSGRCAATQNSGVQDALQWFVDMQGAGTQFMTDGNAADTAFETGATDMIVNGPWVLGDYRAALGANLGVVPLPQKFSSPEPLVGIDGWYVNPNSSNKAAAVQLALLLTNADAQKIYAAVAGDPPIRTDVQVSDELVAAFAGLTGLPRPQSTQFGNYWGPFGTAITSVLSTTAPVSPATATQTACTAMNQANGL
jgi:arabinogalactan oligomer / maltooligosaccharide transport system substrate-binding protein